MAYNRWKGVRQLRLAMDDEEARLIRRAQAQAQARAVAEIYSDVRTLELPEAVLLDIEMI